MHIKKSTAQNKTNVLDKISSSPWNSVRNIKVPINLGLFVARLAASLVRHRHMNKIPKAPRDAARLPSIAPKADSNQAGPRLELCVMMPHIRDWNISYRDTDDLQQLTQDQLSSIKKVIDDAEAEPSDVPVHEIHRRVAELINTFLPAADAIPLDPRRLTRNA